MPGRRAVTNEVLLEKLNNQNQRQAEMSDRLEKLDTKVTQNFESLASVLKEGYVHKDQFQPYIDKLRHMEEVAIPAIYVEISKRLHKEAFAPYASAAKILGATALVGAATLIWKIITEYIRGGVPQ